MLVFFFVFVVDVGFWALDRYLVQIQASGYYGVSYPVTSYISNSDTYSSSTKIFPQ